MMHRPLGRCPVDHTAADYCKLAYFLCSIGKREMVPFRLKSGRFPTDSYTQIAVKGRPSPFAGQWSRRSGSFCVYIMALARGAPRASLNVTY